MFYHKSISRYQVFTYQYIFSEVCTIELMQYNFYILVVFDIVCLSLKIKIKTIHVQKLCNFELEGFTNCKLPSYPLKILLPFIKHSYIKVPGTSNFDLL